MKPDYKTNDPKGWCGDPKRGAALGRPKIVRINRKDCVKLYLNKIRIDSGGYDSNGTYFGFGKPLYWYADANGNIDCMLRASNRLEAKQLILKEFPNAKFFR